MPYDFSGITATPNNGLSQEELRRLIEQSKNQQAQGSPEGQAKPSAGGQPKPTQKPQQAGPAAPGQPGGAGGLDAVGKFIEEKIGIPGADLIDNVFQGNQKTPDQIAKERLTQRINKSRQLEGAQRQMDSGAGYVVGEGVRAVLGLMEDGAESIVNLPGQGLDLVTPYTHKPIRANIIRENTSPAGQALRTIGRYVLASRVGGALTGGRLTAGQTGAALVGGRAAQGFIEDFIGADGTADDTTLVGMTPFTRWLQTSDDNTPIANRTLVGLEGALFEVAGGGALDALKSLRRYTKGMREIKALQQGGKAVDPKLIEQVQVDRVAAEVAAKQLDDVAHTFEYGGDPEELVIDAARVPEYTDQLKSIDEELSPIDEEISKMKEAVQNNVGLTNSLSQLGGSLNMRIAGVQAELPDLQSLADAQKAQQIKLSLSKGQVARLQGVQLPEGVTITAGRRVQGLTPDNIDDFRASIAELAASGDKVAQNLSTRLDSLELPERLPDDFRSREVAEQELADLKAQRDDTFSQSVEQRLIRKDLGAQIRNLTAQSEGIRLRRNATMARLTGNGDQFKADYQPVNLTTQNVTSINKERAGGQPGFDLYFEDKRFPALLDGRVKEIGRQGGNGSGYGNYVVVESIDPKTGKSVDVLYAHLADGSINVKEGDLVGVGQQIAKQGGTGRVISADGTIASVDFLAPAPKGSKSMTPYGDWSRLVDDLTVAIQKGQLQPSQVGRKAPSVAPEVVEQTAQQVDEAIPVRTRREALEEGYEVDELTPVRPRTDVAETFSSEPHDSVVGSLRPGKAGLTDIDVYSLNNGTPEGLLLLQEQVQKIDRAIMYGEAETIAKIQGAEELSREWAEMPVDDILKTLEDPNVASSVENNWLLTAKGYAASGLQLRELQDQILDLSYNTLRNDAAGAPEAAQDGIRLLDRMQAMLQIRTVHKQVASGKLRELQYIGENLGRPEGTGPLSQGGNKAKLLQDLQARYSDQLAKDEALYRTFDSLRQAIRNGDPAAFAHLKRVAQGLSVMAPTTKNFRVMQSVLAAVGKDVDALFVNSILSGPVTQARNIWGNFYQTTGHPLLAYLRALLPGKKNAVIRHQAVAALGATLESYMEFASLVGRATREQWNHLDTDAIKEYSMWDETLERNMARIERMKDAGELHWHQEMLYSFAVNFRTALESPTFRPMMAFMGGVDNTFKVIAARQLASRRAVEDAFRILGDAPLTGKRAAEFAEQVRLNKEFHMQQIFDSETGQVVDPEAIELGQIVTFQTPIGEADTFTRNLNALSSVPLMKTLGLTFVKTPSAILKGAANLTPGLSSIMKRMDVKYQNGSDFYRASRDGAEALSYLMLVPLGYLGAQGVITGAGPLAGRERDLWLQTHKPFTITVGDLEINYQSWEPAATPMGLVADLGALGWGDRQQGANALSVVGALMSNVINKSYLAQISTMAQVIGAVTENDYKRLGENIVRGLVPYSGFRSQVGQMIDPAMREMRSQIEPAWSHYIKKNLGLGATKLAPERVDEVTGRPLVKDGIEGIGGNIAAILNPLAFGARLSKNRFEPVHKYLDEVGLDVSSRLNKVGSMDLTNDEMAEYIKLRAGNGEMKNALLSYFNSDRYKKVDKPQMEYELSIGKEYKDTEAHRNAKAIVEGFHRRAIAQMSLGLTDVSKGFAERYRKAQKEAFRLENQLNQRADVLRPQAGQPLNTNLLY